MENATPFNLEREKQRKLRTNVEFSIVETSPTTSLKLCTRGPLELERELTLNLNV